MTYAYLSFKNAKDRDIAIKKKFTIRQGKTDKGLFISDPTAQRNMCNNCGNPNHVRAGCNIPVRQFRKTNSVKNTWKEKSKSIAQNMKKSYAQIVADKPKTIYQHNNNSKNVNNGKNAKVNNNNFSSSNNKAKGTSKQNLTHTSSSSPKNYSMKKSHNNQQVSQVQQQYLNSLVDKLVKQLESPSPPSTSKNDANKHVRKDPEYESSSSEEEKIENMMQTQRKLISRGFVNSQQTNNNRNDKILFDGDEEPFATDNEDDANIENNVKI
ncbi:hypothetical protein RclHR1_18990003 [Rhizophagus clarus]|uniref:Uncharacterized protein n=1 Tax=Rhizophagus clarus TaxID=94130 RepID=A0A2Z6QPX5_9GLOM|nr:hypothetical protein RclHR1_18990003 [Rhizophagus clarus]